MDSQDSTHSPLIVRIFNFVIKLSLLLIVIGVLLYQVPDIRNSVGKNVTYFYHYTQLLNTPPPTENSLPNPLIDAHLTDTWGASRSGGRKHEGIDIFAKRGTPIHSTSKGLVYKVGVDTLGGNVVIIIGSGGVSHYYAHLDDFANITKGDWVEAGDVIGYVGNSGNAQTTPPHLHYGIYTQSRAINPYPLLQK